MLRDLLRLVETAEGPISLADLGRQLVVDAATRPAEEDLAIGPVSYTHLDVYKRQLLEGEDNYCFVVAIYGGCGWLGS